MCLIKAKKIKKREGPITAYKIVAIYQLPGEADKAICSPICWRFEWEMGKTMTAEGELKVYRSFWGAKHVEGGAFHSFKNLLDAHVELNNWFYRSTFGVHYAIAEVEIPEDAVVYKGKYGIHKSYASTKMKITKILCCTPTQILYL
jgi:hypothetical protein